MDVEDDTGGAEEEAAPLGAGTADGLAPAVPAAVTSAPRGKPYGFVYLCARNGCLSLALTGDFGGHCSEACQNAADDETAQPAGRDTAVASGVMPYAQGSLNRRMKEVVSTEATASVPHHLLLGPMAWL